MTFSWKTQKLKTEAKQVYRIKQMAKDLNSDFRRQHPNLAKEAELGKETEIKKYVHDKILKQFKYGETPKRTNIQQRFNRNV